MADVQVPSIATATPAAADTVLGVQGGAVKRFSVAEVHAANTSAVNVDDTGKIPAAKIPGAIAETKAGGVVAFVFDDGYQSVYDNALPLFEKYGFTATLALEIDKIGQDYGADPDYPVCTTENLREFIRAGWEVCNHPALNTADTEANIVAAAQAENQLLIDLLTGDKVKDYGTGVVSAGAGEYADEFGAYRVTSAVYRGGVRNDTTDKAYRFVFDKIRSINGSVAERGDHLYVFGTGAERTMQMSAYPADTTSNSILKSLAFVESIAQTRSKAILYAHDVPATTGGATPYIAAADLETLLRRCRDLGIAVVPLAKFGKGNAIGDSTFENSSGSFAANSGDTAEFTTSGPLHNATRAVSLTATAYRSNLNTHYDTEAFVCEPFCRYRIRIRYLIETELVLNGGTANRNHGLSLALTTLQGNVAGYEAATHANNYAVLNDPAATQRLPYLATGGEYAEHSVVLVTGFGSMAKVRAALFQCTGTVKIGQIIVEKLDSLIDRPLAGTHNFDTTLGRTIYLPVPNTSNGRQWEWEVTALANPVEPTATYTYAYNDSASIATPTEGQTCYVLGAGAGAFAGQGGKLATYTGGSWGFGAISNGTFFKVTTFNGVSNVWVRHRGVQTDGTPLYETFYSAIANDQPIVKRVSSGSYKVFESSGRRSDAFTWVARPRAVSE